jgi:hypothetical protein
MTQAPANALTPMSPIAAALCLATMTDYGSREHPLLDLRKLQVCILHKSDSPQRLKTTNLNPLRLEDVPNGRN